MGSTIDKIMFPGLSLWHMPSANKLGERIAADMETFENAVFEVLHVPGWDILSTDTYEVMVAHTDPVLRYMCMAPEKTVSCEGWLERGTWVGLRSLIAEIEEGQRLDRAAARDESVANCLRAHIRSTKNFRKRG